MDSITLSELTEQIQQTIRGNFNAPVWIRAEISELRENPGGHCYLELIEKDTDSDTLLYCFRRRPAGLPHTGC